MKLLIRFIIRALVGFPLPRLLASKDKLIREQQGEIGRLRDELRDLTAYNRKLVDSVLVRSGVLPTEQREGDVKHVTPPTPAYDDDQWEREAHQAELEQYAVMAASDDAWYARAKESASVDPEWIPVVLRADELRRKLN